MFNQLFDLKLNTQKEKADATYSFVYDIIKSLIAILGK